MKKISFGIRALNPGKKFVLYQVHSRLVRHRLAEFADKTVDQYWDSINTLAKVLLQHSPIGREQVLKIMERATIDHITIK